MFEEWAAAQREHLLQRALSTLERLVERAQWRGAYTEALGYAHRLVALEPLLEANQRAYMRLLALNGETAAALAQYRQFQSLLAQELAAEPEEATTALYEQIRRGDTPGCSRRRHRFGVPLPPTPLVGRGDELRRSCARLREMNGRLLTITGTGGIGKTRLAIEAAHALRYDFEDGVYFVELAALNDAALVADSDRPGTRRAGAAASKPSARRCVTICTRNSCCSVLDNFEHVVTAAPLVAELLAACSRADGARDQPCAAR